ncbi:hypothetical protein CAC42_3007 [Sphaceloma murrayae]|uniref:Rhodopsin domain-containing protein n=1 Tax=Sphaceloma murrayae TaxID=2082308 RepID=A0A2K1QRE6_9PEZI|nr:hypothetical protein CAC42_3007 [Sphaceloma murrayae]
MAMHFHGEGIKELFIVACIFLALPWIAMGLRVYLGLVSAALYIVTSILFKISLAIFVLRFLQQTWQRRLVIAATTISTVTGFGFFLLVLLQCGTPSSMLSNHLTDHCGPWHILQPINYLYAAIHTITDWIFALVPIAAVRSVNIPRRARISASLLLGLAAITPIASLVRMAFIEGLNVNKQLFPSPAIGITSVIELGLGMTAASCATLRPMFSCCLERAKHTVKHTLDLESPIAQKIEYVRKRHDETGKWTASTVVVQHAERETKPDSLVPEATTLATERVDSAKIEEESTKKEVDVPPPKSRRTSKNSLVAPLRTHRLESVVEIEEDTQRIEDQERLEVGEMPVPEIGKMTFEGRNRMTFFGRVSESGWGNESRPLSGRRTSRQ